MTRVDKPLYMVGIKLDGLRAIVVGGGPVGLDKTEKLLACGARVSVVAEKLVAPLRALADEGSIEWRARAYDAADLDGAAVALVASDDHDLDQRVFNDATARGILVNVHDVPELCTFQAPAIVRHGPVSIAISTSGASPALAVRMKREIADRFGEPYARLAELLNDERGWARETLPTFKARRDFFDGIVNGEPDPIELLRAGDEEKVRARISEAKLRAASA
jgi:siroheme synthase-like protein